MVEVGVDRKIEIGFGKVNRTVGLVANRVDDGIGLVERLVDIDDRIEGEVAWVGRSIALVGSDESIDGILHCFGVDHTTGPRIVAPESDEHTWPIHRKGSTEEDVMPYGKNDHHGK